MNNIINYSDNINLTVLQNSAHSQSSFGNFIKNNEDFLNSFQNMAASRISNYQSDGQHNICNFINFKMRFK